MTDEEGPSSVTDDTGEGWVTANGAQLSSRRVPGIYDVPETTYVPPAERMSRRTLIVGSAIALGSIAIAIGLVLIAGSNDNPRLGRSELNAAVTLTSSSTRPATTTTTTTGSGTTATTSQATITSQARITSTTTRAALAGLTAPAGVSSAPAAPKPPTPRATADVARAPYQPVPVPKGVSATLTSCSWHTGGGGQLQAVGTLTSASAASRHWTLTMHWLQNCRELSQQSGAVDLAPGETKSWTLAISAPNPPADLACSLEIK